MTFYVLLIGIVLVWFVVRTVRQGEALRRVREQRAAPSTQPRPGIAATDTIACPRCRAYVPADRPTACQRTDCPFPRAG